MQGSKTKERLQKKRENRMNEKAKAPADIKQTSEDTFVFKVGESPQKSKSKPKKKNKRKKDKKNETNSPSLSNVIESNVIESKE